MISVIISSPNGLKSEYIKDKSVDYILSKYKLDRIKDKISNVLQYSINSPYSSSNSIDIYVAHKDILSMDSVYICSKASSVSERLYQLKCRLISHIKTMFLTNSIHINQLDFCANLFINILPEVKSCKDPFLRNDVKWLKGTKNTFTSRFENDKRQLTDREFQFLVLLGMMTVYAEIPREKSYEYAKDLLNLCSAYENSYIKM